ncbi:MAG TPA: hypothetical protein VGM02_00990 [Acidobacteriaceae bacterium]|jgi:hypothetical protein
MTPDQLTAASFSSYPPQARQFATAHLALLKQLPIAVAPAFLREIIVFDWRFPAERRTFERQCVWLESLTPEQRARLLAPFQQIRMPADLAAKDWVGSPQPFLQELTAYLWSSSQIDGYRRAAQDLLAVPLDETPQKDRFVIVVVGKDAQEPSPQLFRKLAPHGITVRNLQWTPETPRQLHATLAEHAAKQPSSYTRWYIDGGNPWPHDAGAVELLSYAELRPVRENVLDRMNRFTHSGPGGAEGMRSMLENLHPAESGADAITQDPLMQHFITMLFVEGSGTQIYSTSFVQWAARETLRRAQPEQLLVRFAPRQRQRTLNQLFDAATNVEVPDPEGSLRDADISAYYILLDLLRIADPSHITFLAWRENHGDAVLISPRAPAGKRDDAPIQLADALAKYA